MARHETGLIDRLVWRTKSRIRRSTWAYLTLARFRSFRNGQPKVLPADAELVMDAFPRSANSFSYEAFLHAQGRKVPMIHHFHAPGAVVRGIERGLPALVIIREPVAAVMSMLILIGRDDLAQGFRDYLNFYEPLEKYRDDFVLARFKSVVTDFGAVTRAVNERFGTSFAEFEHTPENDRLVKDKIADDTDRLPGSDGLKAQLVSKPTDERERYREELRAQLDLPHVAPLRERATALYERWIASADV